MKILNTLDIIKAHFELTSKILQTNSADEVVSVKASLKLKGKEYEQVIAKEDLNLTIIKEALDYLNQGPLTKLQDVVKRCSLEEEKKTPKIIEIDSAWIQILNQRIKVFTQFYPNMATADKQDLFSQPKTSEAWQELQKNITYRTLGTKQELAKGTENIRTILLGLFSVIREKTQGVESPQLPSTISMVKEAFARKKDFEMTEAMAGLFLINPNEHIKKAWSVADDPLVSTLVGFTLPHIGYDKCIYVPKIFPAITKELIQQEYQNLSINKFGIDNKITLPELKTEDERAEIIRDLFTPNPSQKVMVRILSSEPLLIENNVGEKKSEISSIKQDISFLKQKLLNQNSTQRLLSFMCMGEGIVQDPLLLIELILFPLLTKLNLFISQLTILLLLNISIQKDLTMFGKHTSGFFPLLNLSLELNIKK